MEERSRVALLEAARLDEQKHLRGKPNARPKMMKRNEPGSRRPDVPTSRHSARSASELDVAQRSRNILENQKTHQAFRIGDEIALSAGSYVGTTGVFLRLRPDAKWADAASIVAQIAVTRSNGWRGVRLRFEPQGTNRCRAHGRQIEHHHVST